MSQVVCESWINFANGTLTSVSDGTKIDNVHFEFDKYGSIGLVKTLIAGHVSAGSQDARIKELTVDKENQIFLMQGQSEWESEAGIARQNLNNYCPVHFSALMKAGITIGGILNVYEISIGNFEIDLRTCEESENETEHTYYDVPMKLYQYGNYKIEALEDEG